MDIKDTIDFQLRSTTLALMRMYNLLATEHGITQSIGYCLINIPREGIPATKIAPLMGMGMTSLSRLLKKLEDEGFIYRNNVDHDKRMVIIFLTNKGLEIRKQVKQTVIEFNNRILDKIPTKNIEIFNSIFDIIKTEVEEQTLQIQENKLQ